MKPSLVPRRVAAALLVMAALVWDLGGSATVAYPFTATPAARGRPVEVEYRQVPEGLFPPGADTGTAVVDLPAGVPLLPYLVGTGVTVPDGWWTVPIEGAAHAASGDRVMLVSADPPLRFIGLVVSAGRGDRYSGDYRPALVALPEEEAALASAASSLGGLVVAVQPGADTPS
ncbi:MAG: hypothetical protein GWN48_21330, partial [Actinobacteria bacterium]|nr:hypothetical protein [Actinomycetota bacterium]